MTATIFFSIFFSLFISHLPRPLSESTGSTKEAVGASSSSTSNLDDIKQRLVNSIKNLLDIDIEHNSDLDNNKQQQQDNIPSVPTAQPTAQPTVVPSASGTSSTSVLPQLAPITINESNIIRQLNAITISLKLRDNNLYQTSSTTLLNYYDNFSSIYFLANNTPINLNVDEPILKHLNDLINNMRPSQQSSSTSTASEWFVCLTEEEHQHYQQHQHLQARPFNHHQQQKPRLHNDAIKCTQLPHLCWQHINSIGDHLAQRAQRQHPLSLIFHPHPNRQQHLAKVSSTSWLHRAGTIIRSVNSATNNTEWGYLNSIIMGASVATLNFIRESSFQASHIIDFNLVSSPQHVHIASIISVVQHANIRQRLRNWLHQFHQSVYAEFLMHQATCATSGQRIQRHQAS